MRSLRRIQRYVSAWRNLGEFRRTTCDRYSLEEIVARVFSLADEFFRPIQVEEELVEALREVQALQPRFIVEIGTAGGGTFLLWSRVAHPEATIVTVDLPGGPFGGGYSLLRVPLFRRIILPGQKLHILRGDSHETSTLERVKACLGGNAADFLFIDGDHSDAGVRADYRLYGPLVRPGGLIAFHDIGVRHMPGCDVYQLWAEIRGSSRSREILVSQYSYGIGLLYC